MLDNNNCIQEIIGIKGLEIKKVINVYGEIHIYFRLKQEEMICPKCGSKVNHVHDYREQQLKDEEISGQKTILHYNKRRYRCPECGKRFAEENEIAGRYQRITRRLMKRIIK
ncbi:MAG: transposase, partial [Christensenellaceae bacterium]|nr:transposase [Christensenellaceae bacterium]